MSTEREETRIPRRYKGTDLASAFLAGRDDALAGVTPKQVNYPAYCPPEWEAHKHGWASAKGGQR